MTFKSPIQWMRKTKIGEAIKANVDITICSRQAGFDLLLSRSDDYVTDTFSSYTDIVLK